MRDINGMDRYNLHSDTIFIINVSRPGLGVRKDNLGSTQRPPCGTHSLVSEADARRDGRSPDPRSNPGSDRCNAVGVICMNASESHKLFLGVTTYQPDEVFRSICSALFSAPLLPPSARSICLFIFRFSRAVAAFTGTALLFVSWPLLALFDCDFVFLFPTNHYHFSSSKFFTYYHYLFLPYRTTLPLCPTAKSPFRCLLISLSEFLT